jgi:hypothetical protein
LTWPVLPPNAAVPVLRRKSAAGPPFLQSVPGGPPHGGHADSP